MRRAAIVAPVRTAVGTFGGSLRPLRAEDLAAKVVAATVQRSGGGLQAVITAAMTVQTGAADVVIAGGVESMSVDDRLNVNGSGISLGHRIGATGVRILTTMLHELRTRGGGLALETMCIGGGQGIAALFRGVTP
jgi:acetyl-CoA acetyltransferase